MPRSLLWRLRETAALTLADWASCCAGKPLALPLCMPAANGRLLLMTHPAASVSIDRATAIQLNAKLTLWLACSKPDRPQPSILQQPVTL